MELFVAREEIAYHEELSIVNYKLQRLIQELEIHQLELKTQNSELLEAQFAEQRITVKYRELFDLAPVGYLTLSNLGEIKEINLHGAKILGKKQLYLQGSKFGFCVSEDTKLIFSQFLTDVFNGTFEKSCEVTLSGIENSSVFVHLTGIVQNNGEQCFMTMVDISFNLKHVKLMQSEQRYQALVEWSPYAVLVHRDLKIVYANPAALKMFGVLTEHCLVGTSIKDLIHPDSYQTALDRIHKAIKDGGSAPMIHLKYLKLDGTIIEAEVQGIPIMYDGFLCIHASLHDITDRMKLEEELKKDFTALKEAEIALQRSHDKYTSMISNISDVIGIMGADGIMTYKSPNIEKWFGWLPQERLGTSGFSTIHPDDLERIQKVFYSLLENDSSVIKIEFRYACKDGSYKPIELAAANLLNDPLINGVLLNYRDITERHQAEEEIKHKTQELIKINAEKDKFFSIIAHDLRGPFNGFLGLTQLMVEESENFSGDEIQEFSKRMNQSASNLFSLLENLLEWARLQRGFISFTPEPFLVLPMVSEIFHLLLDSANKKEIGIINEIPAELGILADKYMLGSIIRNLLSNALKFTPKGGEISIGAKSLPGNFVEFFVRDSGIGMSRKMIDDLFRIDVQTSRRGTENESSTGLGLILCKEFIEKHNGEIWVESEEGIGSVFYFTICYAAGVQTINSITNNVKSEVKNIQMNQLKILIVEDDEISQFLILAIVKKYSREILHVKTGSEAIEVCKNNTDLDLILMDIKLPGLDGYEAARQIRKFNMDVIIIAQTAFALSGERDKAIAAGCNDYISKPIIKAELLSLIRKHI